MPQQTIEAANANKLDDKTKEFKTTIIFMTVIESATESLHKISGSSATSECNFPKKKVQF
jgi:hypothetical protein